MYKVAITGKANVGKNTVAELLYKELNAVKKFENPATVLLAFADPIKAMIQIAYPEIPHDWLYGASANRSNVIPGAFREGVPLTVRQLLIDLGNDFGRAHKPDIWLRNFDHRFLPLEKDVCTCAIVTDVRFRNEFNHLKSLGFFQIRLLRNSDVKINDISETNQDGIENHEFNYVLHNNGTLDDLKEEVKKIVSQLI